MNPIKIESNAKINLSLNVTGISKGMHLLDMIVVSVSHADTIIISPRFDGVVNVEVDAETDVLDITARAAREAGEACFLGEENRRLLGFNGADICVTKGVLKYGGLGGSGTVVAGIFRGWRFYSNKGLLGSEGHLKPFKWGSDVDALITGGFLRVKGTGNEIENLGDLPRYYLLLAAGNNGVNTGLCYTEFDRIMGKGNGQNLGGKADNERLILALKQQDYLGIKRYAHNMLYPAARQLNNEIDSTLSRLQSTNPIYASMSGSGATCFALYPTESHALSAQSALSSLHTALCHTTPTSPSPPARRQS